MGKAGASSVDRAFLLRLIDEAFEKQAWYGPNLKGSIRRVSAELASWRPQRGRKCIAEIVLHCAYWKYAVRRRIRGDKRGSFVLKGSNWFTVPSKLSESQWRHYRKLLEDEHVVLRETIAEAPLSRLTATAKSLSIATHVHGVAMHDIYHAGQIQTLKKLGKRAPQNAI